jgi:Mrp family chromosome partitioning ATPase
MHLAKKAPSPAIDRLATVWAIIEARKRSPVLLLIAGATAGDDTTSVARGLAVAAGHAGQRAGYYRLNADGLDSLATHGYSELIVPECASRRAGFDAALADWRLTYDVIIIDAADAHCESLAGHAARIADGVVIAVCGGRAVVTADRELATLLREVGASVFGAVYCGKAAGDSQREPAHHR